MTISELEQEAQRMLQRLQDGDREALSRAITLVESDRIEDEPLSRSLLEQAYPHAQKALRLGITGVPGVGKSTFIDALGIRLIDEGSRVAVLAIDPSSVQRKGSILGDKTRMERLSQHEKAFIRPSPTRGALGGVTHRTQAAIVLCAAAGYDHILIETVGVGQNEQEVDRIVDLTILLALAGSGDELQGIKRGIMEIADIIAVNKADGSNIAASRSAAQQLRNALQLMPPREGGLRTKVCTCSSIEDGGLDDLHRLLLEAVAELTDSGALAQRRASRSVSWMQQELDRSVLNEFYRSPMVRSGIADLKEKVRSGELPPTEAVKMALALALVKRSD